MDLTHSIKILRNNTKHFFNVPDLISYSVVGSFGLRDVAGICSFGTGGGVPKSVGFGLAPVWGLMMYVDSEPLEDGSVTLILGGVALKQKFLRVK